ncbi:ankyrin repeat domain-containing protein [Candidatus Dependentiae bacterium]|nr:ankyrin repeat domain-containing protein [Candidatus Dependentiae bacterium]MBU4387010.1 ankyrin repeat domain-containing protein [Candidatus Dependentiae bacterium]MCG2756091.1 ankyrin repeat domain-containing protein [Candidatus Dependentiae bacterium]
MKNLYKILFVLSYFLFLDLFSMSPNSRLIKNILDKYKVTDVNKFIDSDLTPIIMASAKGNWDDIDILLKNGADIEIVSKTGETTALIEACIFEHYDIARSLLAAFKKQVEDKYNEDKYNKEIKNIVIQKFINQLNKKEYSALSGLCQNFKDFSDDENLNEAKRFVFRELLVLGGDFSVLDPISEKNLLMLLVTNDDFKMAEILLEHLKKIYSPQDENLQNKNLDERLLRFVNFRDHNGQTALFYACANGDLEMVTLLCDYGAEIDVEDNLGLTPLHLACCFWDVEIVDYLINKLKEMYPNNDDLLNNFIDKKTKGTCEISSRDLLKRRGYDLL